jgi:ATP/ADP translocase
MPLLVFSAIQPTPTLWVAALAFFALKSTDYSIRNVANEMVYQPLDFDARYLGKEVIGVFANRFGKSGMSLILSGLTTVLPTEWMGARQLSQFAVAVGSIWSSCSVRLSKHVVTNKEAEAAVIKRRKQKLLEETNAESAHDKEDSKKI